MEPFNAAIKLCSLSRKGIHAMANQLGKRFFCSQCGTLVLCVKAGGGSVVCCDAEMEIQAPRNLPSSD